MTDYTFSGMYGWTNPIAFDFCIGVAASVTKLFICPVNLRTAVYTNSHLTVSSIVSCHLSAFSYFSLRHIYSLCNTLLET